MKQSRRSFLSVILSLPLIATLSPKIFGNNKLVLYGDWEHDDTEALQAWIDGKPVYNPDGSLIGSTIKNKKIKCLGNVSPIQSNRKMENCWFNFCDNSPNGRNKAYSFYNVLVSRYPTSNNWIKMCDS